MEDLKERINATSHGWHSAVYPAGTKHGWTHGFFSFSQERKLAAVWHGAASITHSQPRGSVSPSCIARSS
jgi:hypothetical protein